MGENNLLFQKVRSIVIEALSIDQADDVTLDSRLIQDLGAESIDFIDISFRLEKEFGIAKVNANNIFPFAYLQKDLINDTNQFIHTAVEEIKVNYPHIDDEVFENVSKKCDKFMLFSVQVIHKYVEYNAK